MTSHRRTRLTLAAVAVLTTGLLTACSADAEPERTAEERLAAAKAELDKTTGVRIELATDRLPKGVNGLLSADGIGTHDPAFEGSIKVTSGGLSATVPVVAVNGLVYAKLPYTSDFAQVDPADYNAPDPADLMDTEEGLSSLLTAAEDVEEGKQVRDGDVVLSELTGTLPGEKVAAIIPSAEATADFDVSLRVDDSDRLDQLVLTGPFYPDAGEVTYTIDLSLYGSEKDITEP